MKNTKDNDSILTTTQGTRVAYYWVKDKQPNEHWDEHWRVNFEDSDKFYKPHLSGYLGVGQLRRILLKHLPRKGLILEGGCGMGQYVLALRARGYDCFGIDFAESTVQSVRSRFPELPVSKGNVLNLELGDQSLDAYISLGIVEHFQEGPQKAISEAFRVLKKNGIFLVSVPHSFSWRQDSVNFHASSLPESACFYQYAFHPVEFREFLLQHGFSIQAEYGMESHFILKLRYSWFKKILELIPQFRHLDLLLDPTCLGKKLGRMRMYVAVKK